MGFDFSFLNDFCYTSGLARYYKVSLKIIYIENLQKIAFTTNLTDNIYRLHSSILKVFNGEFCSNFEFEINYPGTICLNTTYIEKNTILVIFTLKDKKINFINLQLKESFQIAISNLKVHNLYVINIKKNKL